MNLKKIIKSGINRALLHLGYGIVNLKPDYDISLYEKGYGKEAVVNKVFFNIGAGNFFHPAWTNVDHHSERYDKKNRRWRALHANLPGFGLLQKKVDFLDYDLLSMKRMSIRSNTAKIIYISHVIEHITDDAALHMLKEAYRILEIGGILRITNPNIDLDYRAYMSNDRHYFTLDPNSIFSIQQLFLDRFVSCISEKMYF